ncbi:hypothetical protein D3C79_907720 [compost metagenome]
MTWPISMRPWAGTMDIRLRMPWTSPLTRSITLKKYGSLLVAWLFSQSLKTLRSGKGP